MRAALLAGTALASPALAVTPAPEFSAVDANGVDLVSGLPQVTVDEGGIGSGPGALRIMRIWAQGAGFTDNWTGEMFNLGSTKVQVQLGGMGDVFTRSGSNFVNDKANGATLVLLGSGNYLYTTRDGTKVEFLATPFNPPDFPCPGSSGATCRVPL